MDADIELRSREKQDRIALTVLGVVLGLLVLFIVAFMWTSDRDGKIVRFLAWVVTGGTVIFCIVAYLMTPHPPKPKKN